MRFHGIWDAYELYDLDANPHDSIGNNLANTETAQRDLMSAEFAQWLIDVGAQMPTIR